ncbi:scopoletin glucosyltransferase-like [Magnolia sinica]|uniref:scopoletin glucosyltransferase-like n=1 Tax=Magnolia sinica TaxID=86752 RepID=UPI002659AFBA|nr:scopoletin glucosyltransferase-like [Magnolia sinica]
MESKDLHVLFIPFLAHGHMIPMMETARAFAERGVTVSVITTPANASYFQKTIDRAARTRHFIKLHFVHFPCSEAGLPDGCENTDHVTSPAMPPGFWKAIGMIQTPVERLIEEHRPSCIVSDMCLPWTVDIARKHGIPRLGFGVSSFFSIVAWECVRRYRPHDNVDNDFEKFVVTGLPHRIEMTRSQLPDFLRVRSGFTDFIDRIDRANDMSYGILVNTFYEVEPAYVDYYRESGRKAWTIGPVSFCNQDILDKSERIKKACIDED